MESTGNKGLDELRLECTQLAVDDYKNYINNLNRLRDSATVQIFEIEKRIKGKMAKIEDYLKIGLFCCLEDGVGEMAIQAIKDQMKFTGEEIVTDEEYEIAVKNLKEIEFLPIFITASEARTRINAASKTVRANTKKRIIDKLKKLQKDGYTLKGAIKAIEKGGKE